MQVFQEESRNCPVFHRTQLGLTATRHQEHQRSPVHSEGGNIQWLMLLTTPTKPTSTMNSKTGNQPPEWLWNLQKPWCPFFFPGPGGQGMPRTPKHREAWRFWAHDFRISLCGKQCCTALLFQPGARCILLSKPGKWGAFFFKAWTNWELSAVSVTNWIWSESQLDLHC